MQRDVEKNAFTEHEEIFGHLISKAKNYNFDSPILTSCYLKMKLYKEKLTQFYVPILNEDFKPLKQATTLKPVILPVPGFSGV